MRFAWRWLPVVLLGMFILAPDPVAAQQPREGLRKGMKDLTIAGGYTVSHNIPSGGNNPTVRSVLLMPHVGYVLTDPIGPGPLRGNLELLGEPFVQVFHDPKDRVGAGLSALVRWIFATETALLPYVEAGVGVMGTDLDIRQMDCDVGFVLEAGVGGIVFLTEKVAVTGGYRFHHLSNSGICDRNRGINSSLLNLGISYFFP